MAKRSAKPVILVLVLVAILVAAHHFQLGQLLSFDSLKAHRESLQQSYEQNRALAIGGYFLLYVLVTALSFPGATVLTLAGGAVFGFSVGSIVVSFASTVGATAAFLMSRFLLRGWVQRRFGDKLASINSGIEREGAFYLFTLRLLPIFPFFLINLLMGLSSIRLLTFYGISQLGMFPATLVYVNAGTQLGQLSSPSGILSGSLIASFAALGLFPLVARKILGLIRARRVYKRFARPGSYDYNLVVIGAGAGGLVSAYIASAVKAKVALIEKHRMGGDCLNTGCVPSKALIRTARLLADARRAKALGLRSIRPEFEFGEIMERVRRVITKVEPHDSVERYTALGVECIQGTARILSPWEVQVDGGRKLSTRNIVVATGGRPLVPRIPGLDQIRHFTSDTIWDLKELPKRLLVLGGGPIGCELALCFKRFGAEVIQVERDARLLGREDEEVSEAVQKSFRAEGIDLRLGHEAKRFESQGGRKRMVCESQGKTVEIEFDEILLALGRQANVKGFGLEELGVRIAQRGTIECDEFLRTNYPNIYVCGDVAGPLQFTHFAAHQAWYCAVNALFSPFKSFKADYRVIPAGTYIDPEVARVGLNEREAKEKKIPYEVTRYELDDLDRAIADEEDHGFVKVLTVPGKDKILGVTIVGAHSADWISEFVLAMKHGLGLKKILGTIHSYPTFAEGNKYAAGVWQKNHAPQALLRYVEMFHRWRRGSA